MISFLFTISVNGAWSSWGSYGSCNKNCGGGVQERFRHCNRPAPAHGGKGCSGYGKTVRACNSHGCSGTLFIIHFIFVKCYLFSLC